MIDHFRLPALLLLVCGIHVSSHVQAAGVGPIRVETITHGVRLEIIVQRRVYPWNALVPVTVRIDNISRHPFLIYPLGSPIAEVLSTRHTIAYPPAFPNERFVLHADGAFTSLAPGKSVQRSMYVFLRGDEIVPAMSVAERRQVAWVTGNPVFVRLTTGQPAPRIVLSGPPNLHAAVVAREPHVGPLLYTRWGVCHWTNGMESGLETSNLPPTWHPTRSTTIWPPWDHVCAKIVEWHAIAGYLNEPVFRVDYGSGS